MAAIISHRLPSRGWQHAFYKRFDSAQPLEKVKVVVMGKMDFKKITNNNLKINLLPPPPPTGPELPEMSDNNFKHMWGYVGRGVFMYNVHK